MLDSDESSTRQTARPWHLWAVGLFFVILGGVGAYDQIMLLRPEAGYLAMQGFDQAQVVYYTRYPIPLAILWTVAIWVFWQPQSWCCCKAGLRIAAPVALVAFLSQLTLNAVTFGIMGRWQIFGPAMATFDLAILALIAGLSIYARVMVARCDLR